MANSATPSRVTAIGRRVVLSRIRRLSVGRVALFPLCALMSPFGASTKPARSAFQTAPPKVEREERVRDVKLLVLFIKFNDRCRTLVS